MRAPASLALIATLLCAITTLTDAHLTQVCAVPGATSTTYWLMTWHGASEQSTYGFDYRYGQVDANGITWESAWATQTFTTSANPRVDGASIPDRASKMCTDICSTSYGSWQEVTFNVPLTAGKAVEVRGNSMSVIMADALCPTQEQRILKSASGSVVVEIVDAGCTDAQCTAAGNPLGCCTDIFNLALTNPSGSATDPLAMGQQTCIEWTTYQEFAAYTLTLTNDQTNNVLSIPFPANAQTGAIAPGTFTFCFVVPVDPTFGPGNTYTVELTVQSTSSSASVSTVNMRPTEYPEAGVVYDFVGTGQCLDASAQLYNYYEASTTTKAVCENTCSLYRQTTAPPNVGCLGYSYNAGTSTCRLQVESPMSQSPAGWTFVSTNTGAGPITSWSTTTVDAGWECRVKRTPGWAYDLIGYGECMYQDFVQGSPYSYYDQGAPITEVVQEDCAEACHGDAACVGFNFGVKENVNQCQVLHQTTFLDVTTGNLIVDTITASEFTSPLASNAANTLFLKCFRKRDCSKVLSGSVFNSVTRACECAAGTYVFGNRCIACTGPEYAVNAASGLCTCANPKFTRKGDFCVDVDECQQETDSCDVHATCTNTVATTTTPLGYTCACNAGYPIGDGLQSGSGCTSTFLDMGTGACRDRDNVKFSSSEPIQSIPLFGISQSQAEAACARSCSLSECLGYEFDMTTASIGSCRLLDVVNGKGPIVSAGVSAGESATMTCRRRSIGCGDGGVLFLSEQSTVDDVSGELVLRFEHAAFATDKPGNNMVIEFGQCKGTWTAASNTWTTVSGPLSSSWTASVSPGCPTVEFRADLNDALANCNFKYDDSDVTSTKLTTSIRIVTEEVSTTGVRATEFTTKNDNVVVAQIKLGTLSLVQSGQITVFGAVRPDVLVRSVTFDAGTEMMTVLYSTEVQYPYQLASDQSPAQYPSGSAGTPANWPQFPEWVTIDFAEDQQTQNCPAPAVDSNGVCTQNWKVVLQRPKRCAELLGQDLDGTFSFDYTVSCRASFLNTAPAQGSGACFPAPIVASMPQYQDVTLSFSTNSDDYCKRVIAELPLLGTIAIYDEPTYNNVQDTFVFGSTAYAKIELTAKAKIEHAHIEKVELRAQDCTVANDPLSCYFNGDSVVLYTNPHLASADFSKIDAHTLVPTGAAASAVALSKFARTNDVNAFNPAVSTFPSTTPGINSNNARVVFNFEWNSFTSPASVGQDASENTRVYAEVRVKFVDQSAGRRMLLQVGNGNVAMQTSAPATVRSKSAVNFGPVSAASAATPSFAALALTLLAFLRA